MAFPHMAHSVEANWQVHHQPAPGVAVRHNHTHFHCLHVLAAQLGTACRCLCPMRRLQHCRSTLPAPALLHSRPASLQAGMHMLWLTLQPPAVCSKPTVVWTPSQACSLHAGFWAPWPVCSTWHPPSEAPSAVQLSLGHACRFVCRRKLGLHADAGAEYVTPLPENAVLYGSGDKAIVLTRVSTTCSAAKLAPHS